MTNGIGGIGGGGKIHPNIGVPTTDVTSNASQTDFRTALEQTEKATQTQQVSPQSPFELLRSQAINVDQYVEMKVKEATTHLEGVLPASDIEHIQAELHDLIAHDPDIAAMAKRAETG